MSFKPFVFFNNFQAALQVSVPAGSTGVQLPTAAISELYAVISGSDFQTYLTLHKSDFSVVEVIQVESIASSSVGLPAGQTVVNSWVPGDLCSAFIPAELLNIFKQRITRNIGTLNSGTGFTVYPDNLARAAVNTGSHPITVDFQRGTFDGAAQARIVLTDYSGASTPATFTWVGAGGKTISWPGGTAPSFTAAGQELIVDFEYAPYSDNILGSFQRFG